MFFLIPLLAKLASGVASGAGAVGSAVGGVGAAGAGAVGAGAGGGAIGAGVGAGVGAGAGTGGLGSVLGGMTKEVGKALMDGGPESIKTLGHLKNMGVDMVDLLSGGDQGGASPILPQGQSVINEPYSALKGPLNPMDYPALQEPATPIRPPEAPAGPGNRKGVLGKFINTMNKGDEALKSIPILGDYVGSLPGAMQDVKSKTALDVADTGAEASSWKEMMKQIMANNRTESIVQGRGEQGDLNRQQKEQEGVLNRASNKEIAGIGAKQRADTADGKLITTITKQWEDADDKMRAVLAGELGRMGIEVPEDADGGGNWIADLIMGAGDMKDEIVEAWEKAFGGRGKKSKGNKVTSDPLGLF